MADRDRRRFTLAATGDSFIATRISCYDEPEFHAVFDIIRRQTMGFTNLEVLLNDYKGIPAADSGGTYAGALASLVEELKWAGFHAVSRANNHSLDYSYEGMRITTKTLDKAGICHAGVGESLGAARSPAYLDTSEGRVALLSGSSSFAPWGRAGDSRPDFRPRPGLSPLRHSTKYQVSKEQMDSLRRIEASLGVSRMKETAKKAGYLQEEPGELWLAGLTFAESEASGVRTFPNAKDVDGILKWIRDARRQSDKVFYSLHAHEGHQDRETPAEFVVTFAKNCIDAGADAFLGHGPHVLRGIEIYKGKPILYSLGNFIFQNDLIAKHPQDIYDKTGLTKEHTPADMYDARSKNGSVGFPSDPLYWESVVAVIEWDGQDLAGLKLYPLSLGFGLPRSQRGRPMLATGLLAREILTRIQRLSEPYGTKILIEGDKGIVQII